MGLQDFLEAANRREMEVRSQYHLTLGGLIDKLGEFGAFLPVVWDFDHERGPSAAHSYRGYYSDLGIESGKPVSVMELRVFLQRDVLNKTFEGYKGGDFTMYRSTPLWCSEVGMSSGVAIMDVYPTAEFVVLKTKNID